MKDFLYLFLFFAGMSGCALLCKRCEDKLDAAVLKERMASGTQTWMFKTPAGDTVYSTQFKSWGQPDFGSIGANGCSSKYPQKWHYGDCLDWEAVKDDKFHIWINPNCVLIGLKQR